MIERIKLDNKKIILCGDERFMMDFSYVFSDIKPAYTIIDDEKVADNYNNLEKESKDNTCVIVCKYNERETFIRLSRMGYVKGVNCFSAESCFSWLDFPIHEISMKRNVYVWGTGNDSFYFFSNYLMSNPDINIVGVIDSDTKKQGARFFGHPIHTPDEIINDKNAFVIIATRHFYYEIRLELEQRGLKKNKDFISFLGINSYASNMMKRTVYDTPKIDYLCMKPFKAFEIKPEGRTLICGGMGETFEKVMPLFYADFDDVWHSNVLKVIRLSCVNGTYSFCNPIICNYIRESGMAPINVDDYRFRAEYSVGQIEHMKGKRNNILNVVLNSENYNVFEDTYPQTLQVGFDKSCNLRCPSCRKEVFYATSEEEEKLKSFRKRLDNDVFDHVDRIKIAGLGEALASKIYRDMIFDEKLAKKVGKLGLITNGSLLFPDTFDEIAKIWKDINVFVSMDAATKSVAEKLRAGINFDTWKANMEYIGQKRREGRIGNLAFNFVVQRENYMEMPAYIDLVSSYGADQIKFSMITNWGSWTEEEFENISMFDENGEMKKELAEIVRDIRFKDERVHLFRWVDW